MLNIAILQLIYYFIPLLGLMGEEEMKFTMAVLLFPPPPPVLFFALSVDGAIARTL
jgi:hypothetical protein